MPDMTELEMLLAIAKSLEKERFELLERNAELERENAKLRSAHKHDLWCIISTIRMSNLACNHNSNWTPTQIAEFHEKTLSTIENTCLEQRSLLTSSEK
jgi:hypothetical protein